MVDTVRYDQDIFVKARRLLSLSQSGGLPSVVMGSPPTIALNGSSAITGTLVANTDPMFQYLCTVTYPGPAGTATSGHVDHNAEAAGYRTGGNMDVCFSTDAVAMEIPMYDTNGKYRIYINEQAASLTLAQVTNAFGLKYLSVTGMPAGPKDIRLEFDRYMNFGGVKVPNNYNVWRTGLQSPRGIIYGDSYIDGGYGDGTANTLLSLGRQVGYRLGIKDWFSSGASGGGYLTNGGQTGKTARGRAATDIYAYNPDYLMLTDGVNDGATGKAPAALQAEVTTFITEIMTTLPYTIVTATGPWRAPTLATSDAIKNAIKAGFAAHPEYGTRLQYFDPFDEGWMSSGAGRVGATSGIGNSNIYIGTDGGHLVQAGHDHMAKRIADAAVRHFTALAA